MLRAAAGPRLWGWRMRCARYLSATASTVAASTDPSSITVTSCECKEARHRSRLCARSFAGTRIEQELSPRFGPGKGNANPRSTSSRKTARSRPAGRPAAPRRCRSATTARVRAASLLMRHGDPPMSIAPSDHEVTRGSSASTMSGGKARSSGGGGMAGIIGCPSMDRRTHAVRSR